jgi:PBSX family phage terminase large subunit
VTALAERVYTPRGAARTIFERRDPEVIVSGPAGTGKSRACLEKLLLMCLVNPGMKALIVRKTLASLGSTALATWRQHVAAQSLAAGHVDYYGGSAQEPAQYRFSNGSRVYIGGMDKPSKIMSSEYDLIYVQEATELTITDWEALTTRLRNGVVSFQQIIADCNPDRPTHWLKQRAEQGTLTMLYGRHEDNPRLYHEDGALTAEGADYIARLDNLTGVRKERLRYGRWVAAEGVIYDEFDPAVHLVTKPKDPPASWTRYWSVDFGYTNPFVLQCWAVDPDGRLYLYREFYRTQTLVEDHAREALRRIVRDEPRPAAVICDHDAEDRATLERHLGWPTVPARKSVSDGIQAVQARLRPAGDGRPRLFLVRDALVERDQSRDEAGRPACTAEEIAGYVWNDTKDEPVKEDDHGMDALRYMVAHLDLNPDVRVRWL